MNIQFDELRSIKALNLPDILRNYGMNLKPHGPESFFTLCPFHEDQNPSLSVSKKGEVWLWHCFGCNAGGTVIDFVMKKENLSLSDAYRKLKPMTPSGGKSTVGGNGHGPNKLELLKSVADFYHKTFFEDKRAHEYLLGRGIKSSEIYSSFKIGSANGSLKKSLPLKGPMIKALKEIGILNDEGNEFFYNCIVIPLLDEDGNVVSLYGRSITGKQHLYLKGPHKGLLNRQGAFDSEKLILTESVIDALSLYELGIRNVIPCYGTGGFTEDHRKLLEKHPPKQIEIAFDNDQAGRTGAEVLAGKLSFKSSLVKLPDGIKDLNDFLLLGKTKEDYLKLDRIENDPAGALLNKEKRGESRSDAEILSEKDILVFKKAGRVYRVLRPEYDSIHSMRVNIKLSVGEIYHIDVVDLYSDRSRRLYAKKISSAFSVAEPEIDSDLYRILEELESSSLAVPETEKAPAMTEEEKEEALLCLKSPGLLKEIPEDLGRIGCVGEEKNKLLGYLVTVSRKLSEPLSLTVVSQSGAGKSNLADTLESVIPPEEAVRLSRITPQALYYMEKDALKRKILIIEEKEGSRDSDYSIRVLQSKKSLRLAVAMKDPRTGRMKTQIFEVEGPLVVIETTTRTDINPENGSRVFIVYMDESEEQTRRIHLFQQRQKTIEGKIERLNSEKIIRKHRNMQRLLKEVTVDIPFVRQIRFPSKWMRTRRDHMKFLNLIEASAFLHQYQRPLKRLPEGADYIEATIEDYRLAYMLAKDIFGDCLSELLKPDREFYEIVCRMVKDDPEQTFDRRRLREFTGLPDHVVRERLRTLLDLEYLLAIEGRQGKQYLYRINSGPVESKEVVRQLTSPEELEETLKRLRGNFETKSSACLITA